MNCKIYVVWCGLLLCGGQLQAAEAGAAGGGAAAAFIAAGVALSKQQEAIEKTLAGEKLSKIAQVNKVDEKQSVLAKIAGVNAQVGKAIDKFKSALPKKSGPKEAGGEPPMAVAGQKDSPPALTAPGKKDTVPAATGVAVVKPKEGLVDASVAAFAKLAGGKKSASQKPESMQDKINAVNAAAHGGGELGAKIAAANPHAGMDETMRKMAENAAKDSALNRMGKKLIGQDSKIAKWAKNKGIGRNDAGDVNQNSLLARAGNKLMGADSLAAKIQNKLMGADSLAAKIQNKLMGADSLAAGVQRKLMNADSVLARQMTAASVVGRLGSRMLGEKLQYTLQEQQKKVAAFQAAVAQGSVFVDKIPLKQLGTLKDSMSTVKDHLSQTESKLKSQIADLNSDKSPEAKAQLKQMREELQRAQTELVKVSQSLHTVSQAHERQQLKQELAQAQKRKKTEEALDDGEEDVVEIPKELRTKENRFGVTKEESTASIPQDARNSVNPLMVAKQLAQKRAEEAKKQAEGAAATKIQNLVRGKAARDRVAALRRERAEKVAMMASERAVALTQPPAPSARQEGRILYTPKQAPGTEKH